MAYSKNDHTIKSRPNRFADIREKMVDPRCTCMDCEDRFDCEFAFDGYNFDGDCLAVK